VNPVISVGFFLKVVIEKMLKASLIVPVPIGAVCLRVVVINLIILQTARMPYQLRLVAIEVLIEGHK
jgi:hypothetical protein